eukprot:CAMPEP_0178958206 /NCGR_PEP_ID=MMETSP0789-20121207/11457_1 /TAXON_ID=3005 /ORGANISM="Rhizosolenia setigera, Strain CCMP 1694" /LENGTH=415 /DNA_ID=CAMNT_0020640773 /DNA_START=218 /DNA_END=1465 /DNA_ORIENTATION=-
MSFLLSLQHDEDGTTNNNDPDKKNQNPKEIFLKQVLAEQYVHTKKDWSDLRRTLLYARTEARFYRMAEKLNQQTNSTKLKIPIPHVYLADYDLEDWIPENESGMDEANPSIIKENLPNPNNEKGGTLILESVSTKNYFQDSPLTLHQCRQCLKAAAKLHASTWQNVGVLKDAETSLSRASFHLSMRNPKELKGMVSSWDNFKSNFGDYLKEEKVQDVNLGERMTNVAQFVSDMVSVHKPTDDFATIIHGDYKSMNIFLPHENDGKEEVDTLLIDFASVGLGFGMSDVAMHIHHAVKPQDLDGGGELELVKYYWDTLQEYLKEIDEQNNIGGNTKTNREQYTLEVAMKQYEYAVVDYCRFVLGRFWKSATPETMEKRKDNKNVTLMNRSIPSAMAFIRRVDRYLKRVESDYEKSKK